MKDSEIDIIKLKVLDPKFPKTTVEITNEVKKLTGNKQISPSQIFDILIHAESLGIAKRVLTTDYDDARPVTTVSWQLSRENVDEVARLTSPIEKRESKPYIEEAHIVVSQPLWISTKRTDLFREVGPVLGVREAMEKIVIDAKEQLRIACPYYDELFIDVLSVNAETVAKLDSIAVIAENVDPILVRAKHLFPNMKIKTIQKTTISPVGGQCYKVQGMHAKLMIADQTEVLLGSFNFRFSHIHYNIDLGLLASGPIAGDYVKIYDSIWELE
jgi:phosphatidylserine/phosphatidylglycerophosphate/cardiolipin synthase-like enzyme